MSVDATVMVPVAPAVDPEVLQHELSPEKLLCWFRDIEIYVTTAAEAPAVMQEIGRIREREYRLVGAGRNLPVDLDGYDTGPVPYRQLVAWDPVHREIIAMYRYFFCRTAVDRDDLSLLRTSQLFSFSPQFVEQTLGSAVELGRSVVNREAKRAILGLFSVWAGLGAIVVEFPEIRFFFGNVSVYRSWPAAAIDLLLGYLYEHHPGAGGVVGREAVAYRSAGIAWARRELFAGGSPSEAYRRLEAQLTRYGLQIPPILVSYLRATTGLAVYDTVEDTDFGGAYEVALTVSTRHLTEKTRRRIIDGYQPANGSVLQ
ncbi:MAG: GNAT family N-acyltransferase [Alkalispirochaeta sp.]